MFCCCSVVTLYPAVLSTMPKLMLWVHAIIRYFSVLRARLKKYSAIQRLPHQYCAAPGPCNVWCVCVFSSCFLSIFVLTTHTCYQQNTQNWIETLDFTFFRRSCAYTFTRFSLSFLAKLKLLPCAMLVFFSLFFFSTIKKNQEMTSKEKTIDKSSWMGCTGKERRRDNIYLNSLCLVGMIENQKRSNHYYSIGKLKLSTITF